METDFKSIDYLKNGTKRQQLAYAILTNSQLLSSLKQYDPILVGTIPINIDIEGSDLDIICYFTDKQDFINTLNYIFKTEKNFNITEQQNQDTISIVANFVMGDFGIEIFGQNIPTKQQFAYQHMIIEHKIITKRGEQFRQQIIKLKQQGYKTEPAFGIALGLEGNPYTELLNFETD